MEVVATPRWNLVQGGNGSNPPSVVLRIARDITVKLFAQEIGDTRDTTDLETDQAKENPTSKEAESYDQPNNTPY